MLPVPNLDDRRFQDLVDDAKRLVQRRCPEWTDHNVSDPGVTLIEAFATMVDQLLYRLNRVPEAHYLRFLDLIGVRLHPPTAARCDVTFWLAAPREEAVTVPADTEIATPRTETDEPVVFSTLTDLVMPGTELGVKVHCDITVEEAAAVTDQALEDLPAEDTDMPRYEIWRERIRQRFE